MSRRNDLLQRLLGHRDPVQFDQLLTRQCRTEIQIALADQIQRRIAETLAVAPVRIRSNSRRTWRSLRSSTCAADTIVIRLATTFDKISIRCRSRSLIAINPICNLPGLIQTGECDIPTLQKQDILTLRLQT